MDAKRNMEILFDTVCIVAYDYVNTKGDNNEFFDKVRFLIHKYDEETQRHVLDMGGDVYATSES